MISKSNKLVYWVKKSQSFQKNISGEETSSKVPTKTPHVLPITTTQTRHFLIVSMPLQEAHAVYLKG